MNLAKEILINKGLPAGKLEKSLLFRNRFSIFLNKRERNNSKIILG